MRWRLLLVLATLAALLGAPSFASAAGNELSRASVSPGGTAAIAFLVLQVDDTTELLIGLAGVAIVAVIGVAVVILGRRRSRQEELTIAVGERGDTEALLDRRTVRRSKVRLTDDPIVAAMGVEEQVAARRQRTRTATATAEPRRRARR